MTSIKIKSNIPTENLLTEKNSFQKSDSLNTICRFLIKFKVGVLCFLFYCSNIILFLLIAYWFKHDLGWKKLGTTERKCPECTYFEESKQGFGSS